MTTAIAETYLRSTRASERAAAAAYLANAALAAETPRDDRHAAISALTLLADDPSPNVRAAIALALAGSRRAPLHIVLHLAKDQPSVAAPILLRSPLLTEGDLVELVATLDARGQTVIARRAGLTPGVTATLSAFGPRDAVIELARNDDAEILPSAFRQMVERFGCNPELREILIRQARLPVDCRHRLLASIGDVLSQSSFVKAMLGSERAARVTRDACARSTVSLVEGARTAEMSELVARLRETGHLTTAFVLRCMALGKMEFFVHLVAHLSTVPQERVRTILVSGRDLAITALFEKAGFAAPIHQPLVGAIHVWRSVARGDRIAGVHEASQAMIDAMGEENSSQTGPIVSLLRQVQADAMRAAATETVRIAA